MEPPHFLYLRQVSAKGSTLREHTADAPSIPCETLTGQCGPGM